MTPRTDASLHASRDANILAKHSRQRIGCCACAVLRQFPSVCGKYSLGESLQMDTVERSSKATIYAAAACYPSSSMLQKIIIGTQKRALCTVGPPNIIKMVGRPEANVLRPRIPAKGATRTSRAPPFDTGLESAANA